MRKMGPLFTTPRTAKRFVNVYRMLRASLSEEDYARLLDADSPEFPAVMFLAAADTTHPEHVREFLSLLDADVDEWWNQKVVSLTAEHLDEVLYQLRSLPGAVNEERLNLLRKSFDNPEEPFDKNWSNLLRDIGDVGAKVIERQRLLHESLDIIKLSLAPDGPVINGPKLMLNYLRWWTWAPHYGKEEREGSLRLARCFEKLCEGDDDKYNQVLCDPGAYLRWRPHVRRYSFRGDSWVA